MLSRRSVLIVLALVLASASAFTTAPRRTFIATYGATKSFSSSPARVQVTALQERRWNFNEGQSPWGLKGNAEIWNGRFAQMAFVIVFLQELIQGKGVIQGIQEGDPLNLVGVAFFAVSALGLTAWLAIKGDDDFVKRDLERDGIDYYKK
ncbi:hypothetical protein MPSEU_000979000 [Mayamaea pseudoterrestris]|nr:hypothetical protein MPSEU_000979000 [Mayamaea pseudoterrestris]